MSVGIIERRTSQRLFLACWLAIFARVIIIVGLIATPIVILNYEIWELLYVVLLGILAIVMAYTSASLSFSGAPVAVTGFWLNQVAQNIRPHEEPNASITGEQSCGMSSASRNLPVCIAGSCTIKATRDFLRFP